MRIQIERRVRLTLSGTELQTLNPGELFDVAPAIGRVLVAEGWASQVISERRDLWPAEHPSADAHGGRATAL